MGIYVEIHIRRPLEAVWTHSQRPELHERWDLRFTEIRYLPRANEAAPQRFLYATRIGFGLAVRGEGESTGERHLGDGSATSALRFWSDQPLSLIREGSGYWRYVPDGDGTRFLTWYGYRTRFGLAGTLADRVAFRPLMGWATAWSFDRLRRWVEDGQDPALSLCIAVSRTIARLGVAFVFAYHGLVPKLLARDPDELAMLGDAGVPAASVDLALRAAGVTELLFALVLLVLWRRRWPAVGAILLMIGALVGVVTNSPEYLTTAFNPVSLNLLVIALAAMDLLLLPYTPTAARCLRRALERAA